MLIFLIVRNFFSWYPKAHRMENLNKSILRKLVKWQRHAQKSFFRMENLTNGIIRVRSREKRNELITVWDFKLSWKQVLFKWSFISAAFQNDPIFWWTCVGISFRVVFTWYLITRNRISFLSKWPIWNPYPQWFSNAHVH